MMKVITGIIEPDSGELISDSDVRTSFLPQDVPDDITGSAYDVIAEGVNLSNKAEDKRIAVIRNARDVWRTASPSPRHSSAIGATNRAASSDGGG